jgi:homoserine kinase
MSHIDNAVPCQRGGCQVVEDRFQRNSASGYSLSYLRVLPSFQAVIAVLASGA